MAIAALLVLVLPPGLQDKPDAWRILATDGKEAFSVRPDGSAREKVEVGKPWRPLRGGYSACVRSPDRTRIVYVDRDTDSEIYVSDADGGNARKLTDNDQDDGYPAWLPDGKSIVFASSRSGDYAVYVMKADGTDVRRVSREGERAFSPCCAPDGRIAYVAGDAGNRLVLRDGDAVKVLLEDSWIREPVWNPDGRSIACVVRNFAVLLLDLQTGTSRRIPTESIHGELAGWEPHSLDWRPDGRVLAFRMRWVNRSLAPTAFGHGKLFIASPDGTARWIEIPDTHRIDWIRP